MSYFVIKRSFHHSCFQSLIIRVPETKLGLFNYNEFAMYPSSKSIQSPTIQPPPTQPSLNKSSLVQSNPITSLPNLAIPVSYIRKSS